MDEIRLIGADDRETWRDLRLRSLADSPDAFGSTLERELGFTEEDWRLRTAQPSVLAFVGGEPAAMAGAFVTDDGSLHVVAMWTDPAYRGRGLAPRLLDVLARVARDQGRALELDVTRGNGAARRTYERYGLVATGETRPLRPGSDLVVDRMVLPPG